MSVALPTEFCIAAHIMTATDFSSTQGPFTQHCAASTENSCRGGWGTELSFQSFSRTALPTRRRRTEKAPSSAQTGMPWENLLLNCRCACEFLLIWCYNLSLSKKEKGKWCFNWSWPIFYVCVGAARDSSCFSMASSLWSSVSCSHLTLPGSSATFCKLSEDN